MGSIIASAGPETGLMRRPDGRLVGRVRERRLLDGLVESAEGSGAAVVIAGEAGVGKTALLAHVAGVASDRSLRVLRARGEESEAVLAFAVLADLMRPLRERIGELPRAQRQALEVRLALSSGPAGGPLAACAGRWGCWPAPPARAMTELDATGIWAYARNDTSAFVLDSLSSQELQVARGRRPWTQQRRGRGGPVRLPQDRRSPPHPRLPQTRHPVPYRTDPPAHHPRSGPLASRPAPHLISHPAESSRQEARHAR